MDCIFPGIPTSKNIRKEIKQRVLYHHDFGSAVSKLYKRKTRTDLVFGPKTEVTIRTSRKGKMEKIEDKTIKFMHNYDK